jgi:hypothetical protein
MGLDASVQWLIKKHWNELRWKLLIVSEEYPKQLDQDKIIKITDQTKTWSYKWHEAMVNAIIDIFELTHEESMSDFEWLGNLEKVCWTRSSATLPVNFMRNLLPVV